METYKRDNKNRNCQIFTIKKKQNLETEVKYTQDVQRLEEELSRSDVTELNDTLQSEKESIMPFHNSEQKI